MAGTSVKFSLTGEASGMEAALAKVGKSAQASAAGIAASYKNQLAGVRSALERLPQGSILAPKLRAQESGLMRMMGLDKVDTAAIASNATKAADAADKAATAASVDAAKRSNQARALIRERGAAADKAAAVADQIALDNAVEAATRSNKARRLMRERREERIDNWRSQTAAMRAGPSGFQTGGMSSGRTRPGGRGSFAIAGSMFTSVARDSAASLASGAPITQVIAQQAPQVLQALAMMKLTTVAWVAVLAGAGLFAWHKITKGISEAFYGTNKLLASTQSLIRSSQTLASVRKAGDASDRSEAELAAQKIGDAAELLKIEQDAADIAAEKAKNAATEANLKDRLAGGTKTEKDLQLELLQIEKKRLEAKRDSLVQGGAAEAAQLKMQLQDDEQKLSDLMEEQNTLEKQTIPDLTRAKNHASGDNKVTAKAAEDAAWKRFADIRTDIAKQEGAVALTRGKISQNAKTSPMEAENARMQAQNAVEAVTNEIAAVGLNKETATTATIKGGQSLGMTENQRLGAFGGGPTFTLIDINKQQLAVLKEIARASGKAGTRGVNFGK